MKHKIILSILLGSSYLLQSQTAVSQELENKYWTYRDRFRNYFTKVGYEAGESQTAASVYEISAKSLNYRRVNGVEVSTTGPNTYAMGVDYGDAIIDQGWYIMALASEYWLLKNKNQIETDAFKAVCNELYFYIHAIERLDGNADRIFDRSSPVSLNGFFVRSDHQTDYLKQLNTYNVPYNPIEWVKSGGFAGPEFSMIDSSNGIRVYDRDSFRINIQAGISNSDHNTWWQGGPGQFGAHQNWGNEMSQDQLYGILMGFKAVMNWVDSSLYVDPDGALSRFANKNLHQWIKYITHRIMQHVSKTHEGLFGLADQDDLKDKADSICAEITSKPYYRSDTLWLTTPDTFIFILSDTMVDTMIFTFYVRDTVSSTWFPGSSIRTCDVWQELETLKAGNYLFKEGNYVLTNPVNNDNLVTRGAVATALAYPLKLLGESITGQTYPDPYLKLRNNYSFYRWAINAYYLAMYSTGNAGTAKAIDNAALLGAISYLTLFDSKNINADKTLIQVKLGCPEVPKFSVDAMTLCVLQHPLNFQNIDFYEALWKRIPKSNILLAAFEDGLPLNLFQNLAIATGSWDQSTFNDWCDYNKYPYSEILYALMNNKQPLKSKTFYENALLAAQCEGLYGYGNPDDANTKVPVQNQYRPFVFDNVFARRNPNNKPVVYSTTVNHSGVDYMLLYNMYEMSNMLYWGGLNNAPQAGKQCPCRPDTVYNLVNLINSTFDGYDPLTGFYFGNRHITRQDGVFGVTIKPLANDTVRPHYDYYKQFNIRTPAYLLHNLTVTGTQNQKNTINVAQDYRICNSVLRLNNNSEIKTLANTYESFPSLIEVGKNAILEVNNGALIELANNTRLVIELEGTLLYKAGARIILNGPNAVLHIKGKLELAAGAEFKIEGGPAGKGYIIWDNGAGSPHYGLATLEAGAGSSMLIEQANPNVLGLKVEGSTGMVTPFSLAKLKIQNCRVALGPASQLVSQADSTIVHNVQVKGYFGPHANAEFNFKATAKGLHQLGKRNSYNMVTISECAIGLTVFNLGTSEALNMQDVYFENCLTAIHNRGGRLRYKDGNISAVSLGGAYMDLRNGIYGEGTQGASMLENVELSARHFPNPVYHPLGAMEQTHNLKVHGAGNYYFYKSKIQFADYGSKMDQAGLLPVCTEIFDNTTQLQHTTWSKFVAVNQAWNHIHWPTSPAPTNPKKMYFGYMSYLYLDKGQNQIMGYTGGMPYLQALLASDQNLIVSTDPLKWNTSAINATQNQWQTTPETQPSVNYNAIVEHGFPVANTIDINKLPLNTSNWQSTQANYCMNLKTPFSPVLGDGETESDTGIYGNGVGDGERRMPVSPADLGTMLSQHGHNGAAYVQSLRRVLRAMDMRPPNYGAIIDTFRQLLTQPLPDTVSAAVKHVYGLLQDFYLEVRTDKFIPEQDRLAQEQMVFAKMLALQQQLLVLSTDTNSIWHTPRFELTRDKALLYRVFNQRTEAIAFLDSKIPAWQPLYEKEALEVWKCILQWEQSYIDNQVSYNEFIQYSCAESWAAGANNGTGSKGSISKSIGEATKEESQLRSKGIPEKTGNTEIADKNNFTLSPNPAENSFTVASNSGITRVRVYETNGRLLLDLTQAGQTAVEINIETLVRGTYIVAAETPIKTYRRTLVVNR